MPDQNLTTHQKITVLMRKAKFLPNFNQVNDNNEFFRGWVDVYKDGNQYFIVRDIGHMATDLRYLEVIESDALLATKSVEDAWAVLKKHLNEE